MTGASVNWPLIDLSTCDDGHDCPISTVDNWVKTNIAPLISSPLFQRDAVLIITWDESRTDYSAGTGGKVPFIIVGPLIKKGYSSTTVYKHQSLLRLMMKALGLSSYPGNAASARDMDEFFTP